MANSKKKSDPKITTPICPTGYNNLNEYDDYKGQKNYKTRLKMTAEELDTIKDKIDTAVDASFDAAVEELEEQIEDAKGKELKKLKKSLESLERAYPYEEEEDDEGEPTGDFFVKFKSKPKKNRKGKLVRRFALVDANGDPTDVFVGAGSKVRVEAYIHPYFMAAQDMAGVTLYLKAVQVAALAGEGGGGGHSFGKIDGGFVDDGSHDDAAEDDEEGGEDEDDEGEDDF